MEAQSIKDRLYMNKIVKTIYNKVTYGARPHITIYPSFRCNYTCSYCNVLARAKMHIQFPNDHSGKEWADALNKRPPSVIGIVGGEPFEEGKWNLREFLESIDRKHVVAITSNLSWDLDSVLPWLTKIRAEKKVHTTFSFHPSMTDIDTFISKMKVLKAKGISSTASIVAVPAVFSRLEEYRNRFDDAGVHFVIQTFVDPSFNYTAEQMAFLSKFITTIRDKDDVEIPFAFDSNPVAKNCVAGQKYQHFLSNGDAYTCQSGFMCVNSPAHTKWKAEKSTFYLGNLFDGTFKPRESGIKGCIYPCSEYCDRAYAKPVNVK